MGTKEENKTIIEQSIEAGKNQYINGKTSIYEKQVGDKIKTIEKTEYKNGVVKEKMIGLKKGNKVIFG